MSFETDIAAIKTLVEADKPLFKKADDAALSTREEMRKADIAKKPIIPVDSEAHDLDYAAFQATKKLENRLGELRHAHGVDFCECSYERLHADGQQMETCDIPGEDIGFATTYCLRCGGEVEN